MRTDRQLSKAFLAAALALALAPALTSTAATDRGSIKLRDPVSTEAYGAHVPFSWDFSHGSKVTSTSKIYFQATSDGYRWFPISSQIPIRNGAYLWNTSTWQEGTYDVRSIVHGTLILDRVGPIVVDRTAPIVQITQPSEGDVIVEDAATVSNAVVVGTTTLEADTFDLGSGVNSITWSLDDEVIASGSPYEYNFSMSPGPHVLKVTVSDAAGNQTSQSIQMIAGPGPSLVAGEIPEGPGEPPTLPEDPPTLPGAPDPNDPPTVPVDPENPPVDPDNPPDVPVDPENPPVDPDPPTVPPLDPGSLPDGP